jgi:hypothetical protein
MICCSVIIYQPAILKPVFTMCKKAATMFHTAKYVLDKVSVGGTQPLEKCLINNKQHYCC